jgi:hypothetical protein
MYQVAHFWSDLLELLPDVLAPVPHRLTLALVSGAWTQWEREAEAAVREALPRGEAINLLYDAMRWLGKRTVDNAYLISGPVIYCWSDGEQIHVYWDNRHLRLDGLPLWDATVGDHHGTSHLVACRFSRGDRQFQ